MHPIQWIRMIGTEARFLLTKAGGGFSVALLCPRCGGTTVDALQRRGAIDRLLAMLRVHPYHCRRCYGKFYVRKTGQDISPQRGNGSDKVPFLIG